MSKDQEMVQEFLEAVADRYTATDLVDILDLDVWQIINLFVDEILEAREKLEI